MTRPIWPSRSGLADLARAARTVLSRPSISAKHAVRLSMQFGQALSPARTCNHLQRIYRGNRKRSCPERNPRRSTPCGLGGRFCCPRDSLRTDGARLFMPVPRQNVLAMAAITAIFVYLGNRSMKHTTFTVTNTTLTITEPLRKPTVIPLDSINSYYLGDNYLTFDFRYRSWRSRRQKTQFSHVN